MIFKGFSWSLMSPSGQRRLTFLVTHQYGQYIIVYLSSWWGLFLHFFSFSPHPCSSFKACLISIILSNRNTCPVSSSSVFEFIPALYHQHLPTVSYKLPVTFLASAQAGNSVRLKSGAPQVVMANITTATPIRFTPKPALTWRWGGEKLLQ